MKKGVFEVLEPKRRRREDPETLRIREKNARLKEIVAEKEMALANKASC